MERLRRTSESARKLSASLLMMRKDDDETSTSRSTTSKSKSSKSKKDKAHKAKLRAKIKFDQERKGVMSSLERDGTFNRRKSHVPPDALMGAIDARGGNFSPSRVRQALILFYDRHDPDKEDLEDLLDLLLYYASRSGMGQLNSKLRRKYGEDLDDIEVHDIEELEFDDFDYSLPPPSPDDELPPPNPDDILDDSIVMDGPPPPPSEAEFDRPPPYAPPDDKYRKTKVQSRRDPAKSVRKSKSVRSSKTLNKNGASPPPPPPPPPVEDDEDDMDYAYGHDRQLQKQSSRANLKSMRKKTSSRVIHDYPPSYHEMDSHGAAPPPPPPDLPRSDSKRKSLLRSGFEKARRGWS